LELWIETFATGLSQAGKHSLTDFNQITLYSTREFSISLLRELIHCKIILSMSG